MTRVTFAILGIAALMLGGCLRVPPAVLKAVTGQGAKAASKAVGGAVPPKAAKPAQEGGFSTVLDVGRDVAQSLQDNEKKK